MKYFVKIDMLYNMFFAIFYLKCYFSAFYAHWRFETLSFITFRKNALFLIFLRVGIA